MIQNNFYFHPVGQGLFYSGSLNNGTYNFVYDCGTENDQLYVDNEIDRLAAHLSHVQQKSKPVLDFVVISHLHSDHMSGLFHLQQKFQIKKLYLPYLNAPPQIIDLILGYSIFVKGNASYQIGWQLFERLRTYYQSAQDHPDNENPQRYIDEDETEILFIRNNAAVYNSNDTIYFEKISEVDDICWEFVFINKTYSKIKMSQFEQILNKITEDKPDYIHQLIIHMEDRRVFDELKKTLKEIYHQTFGSGNQLNQTSITLMHFPIIPIIKAGRPFIEGKLFPNSYYWNHSRVCGCFMAHGAVTLLTGDAKIDKTMRQRLASLCKLELGGIVQIPHHGSWDNYYGGKTINLPNFWNNFKIQVIPYGLGNSYPHPHTKTVDDILKKHNILISATQNFGAKYKIIY